LDFELQIEEAIDMAYTEARATEEDIIVSKGLGLPSSSRREDSKEGNRASVIAIAITAAVCLHFIVTSSGAFYLSFSWARPCWQCPLSMG